MGRGLDPRGLNARRASTERLDLPARQIDTILGDFQKALPIWHEFIGRSFLPEPKKEAYHELLDERSRRLEIGPENS